MKKATSTGAKARTVRTFSDETVQQFAERMLAREHPPMRRVFSLRANIEERDAYILLEQERQKEREKELQEALAATAHIPLPTDAARTVLEQVARLRFVESVTFERGALVARTHLLFTDIRTEAGSREKVRRCIGAFAISLRPHSGDVQVENLLYPHIRPHWASAYGGSICLGDWRDEMLTALEQSDMAAALTLMRALLESTDDAGAYVRSHNWLLSRLSCIGADKPPLTEAQHVMCLVEGAEGNRDIHAGMVARVLDAESDRSGYAHVSFLHEIDGHVDCVHDGHCYNVMQSSLLPITEEQYNAGSVDIAPYHAALEKLDQLPDGSTLVEGKKAIDLCT